MSSEEILEITSRIIDSAENMREAAKKILQNQKSFLEDQMIMCPDNADQTTRYTIKACYDKIEDSLKQF